MDPISGHSPIQPSSSHQANVQKDVDRATLKALGEQIAGAGITETEGKQPGHPKFSLTTVNTFLQNAPPAIQNLAHNEAIKHAAQQ